MLDKGTKVFKSYLRFLNGTSKLNENVCSIEERYGEFCIFSLLFWNRVILESIDASYASLRIEAGILGSLDFIFVSAKITILLLISSIRSLQTLSIVILKFGLRVAENIEFSHLAKLVLLITVRVV